MLDRRAFLRRLGFGTIAAAAAANGLIDIERLLWTPEKTIILPSPVIFVGNQLVTPEWLTAECLRVLVNNLNLSQLVHRRYSDSYVTLAPTMDVRLPQRYR